RASLGSGEFFGEVSLLLDIQRTATIVASKPTVLLRLDAKSFGDLIDHADGMKQVIERVGSRRVLANERWQRSLTGVKE
ncbi:MAG TPA: cyclic nucleotide-binding domain-containing protein, partial [Anaerolineales bacterium]|nr:cyclic nucleotide-binding domain-containing protein [Anaerolineales bacterium]